MGIFHPTLGGGIARCSFGEVIQMEAPGLREAGEGRQSASISGRWRWRRLENCDSGQNQMSATRSCMDRSQGRRPRPRAAIGQPARCIQFADQSREPPSSAIQVKPRADTSTTARPSITLQIGDEPKKDLPALKLAGHKQAPRRSGMDRLPGEYRVSCPVSPATPCTDPAPDRVRADR